MCKYVSKIWRIIGAVSIILGIVGKKKDIPESIIGILVLWSIIDLKPKYAQMVDFLKFGHIYNKLQITIDQ